MILIADSSALVALSVCESLGLLDVLFGEVKVPQAVFDEVSVNHKPESAALAQYLQGKVELVDTEKYVYLDAYADAGETEAMLLYKQMSADWLLIDDKRGRKIATVNHINTIGTFGVLLSAKKRGLTTAIKPKIDQIENSNIYISQTLRKIVLDMAGESL